MDLASLTFLLIGVLIVAFLYSSVGHAGASGYIAVMTLAGLAATTIRPTALLLNILVATIGSILFWRAGHFSWPLFWPFALLSVPCAYLAGSIRLEAWILKPLLGAVLLFSAARLFFHESDPPKPQPPSKPVALGIGAVIGLMSGLTGTGGGIFLTPLLLLARWTHTKRASATSALFILVNSIGGLAGYITSGQSMPRFAWFLAPAAVLAGTAGSYLGSRRFPVRIITLLLAGVLIIAGCKLLFTS